LQRADQGVVEPGILGRPLTLQPRLLSRFAPRVGQIIITASSPIADRIRRASGRSLTSCE
jgi:hypothetical protein